jgi:two-component system sensor histidine kinase UhpB
VRRTVELVDQALGHVRSISLDLSPPFLDELGLPLALQGYLQTLSERSGLAIDVDVPKEMPEIDRETTIHTFRLVQEATTNVIRHAEATRCDVRLQHDNGTLLACVRDDGRGFDVDDVLQRSHNGHHLGLLGMRERARSMGGELSIESRPGSGSEIRFHIPLNP